MALPFGFYRRAGKSQTPWKTGNKPLILKKWPAFNQAAIKKNTVTGIFSHSPRGYSAAPNTA